MFDKHVYRPRQRNGKYDPLLQHVTFISALDLEQKCNFLTDIITLCGDMHDGEPVGEETSVGSTNAFAKVVKRGKKKKRCGSCDGCTAEECQTCKYCLDKTKRGGSNTLRRPCLLRGTFKIEKMKCSNCVTIIGCNYRYCDFYLRLDFLLLMSFY